MFPLRDEGHPTIFPLQNRGEIFKAHSKLENLKLQRKTDRFVSRSRKGHSVAVGLNLSWSSYVSSFFYWYLCPDLLYWTLCHMPFFAASELAFHGADPYFTCFRCFLAPFTPNNLCSSRMVREARCTISQTAFGGGVANSPEINRSGCITKIMYCLHLVVMPSAVSANVLCKNTI